MYDFLLLCLLGKCALRGFVNKWACYDVHCSTSQRDPTDLIWRKGTPFEVMTGRTAPSSDGLLAEVFWGFPRL